MKTFLIAILVAMSASVQSQYVAENAYWFYFTDKDNNGYSVDEPSSFLSQRSIERRAWQFLPVTESDLPVTSEYIDSLKSMGLKIKHVSKWLNGVLAITGDSLLADSLHYLSFVDSIMWNPDPDNIFNVSGNSTQRFPGPSDKPMNYSYGFSAGQITQLDLQILHNKGYTGKGVHIAVLDAGFINMPQLPAFQTAYAGNQVITSRNFVNKGESAYTLDQHGTNVSSLIIANWPDTIMGTAPDANLVLALTEDVSKETKIEEFAWIEAAEWVDSLGVDIINTSLAYTTFDDPETNYSYEDMDGKTAFITIANSMAAEKGMISVTSAGNSGDEPWYYIGAPADATDILSVGAASPEGDIVTFSSHGPSADYRIKPEVAATGYRAAVQASDGTPKLGAGTSFSAPIMAGAVAVLWQAYPEITAHELMNWIIKSGNRYEDPDVNSGFGIPSFAKAFYAITDIEQNEITPVSKLKAYPNPFTSKIRLQIPGSISEQFHVVIYDLQGRKLFDDVMTLPGELYIPENINSGIYILNVENKKMNFRTRIVKQ